MKISGGASPVARRLLEGGPATAADLAAALGLTPAAVRKHLDTLLADGLVQAGDRAPFGPTPVRGRGRPPKVYALTATGRDAFDQAYDDLAAEALRFLSRTGGDEALLAFARSRAGDLETRYAAVLDGVTDPAERARGLAAALSDDGYAAATVPAGAAPGVQLCQHHCPVAHVAAEFPQLCEAETEAFERLLGRHVTRLSTLATGGGVCTTHVPVTAVAHPTRQDPRRDPRRKASA